VDKFGGGRHRGKASGGWAWGLVGGSDGWGEELGEEVMDGGGGGGWMGRFGPEVVVSGAGDEDEAGVGRGLCDGS